MSLQQCPGGADALLLGLRAHQITSKVLAGLMMRCQVKLPSAAITGFDVPGCQAHCEVLHPAGSSATTVVNPSAAVGDDENTDLTHARGRYPLARADD